MKNFVLVAVLALFSSTSKAEIINWSLECVLNGLEAHQCADTQGPFGNITLEDFGNNTIQIAVNLVNPDYRFIELMLNFNPAAGVTLTSDGDPNNTVTLSQDSFQIAPYTGMFDIGGSGGGGWSSSTGNYSTTLTFSGPVTVNDFLFTDTGGLLFAALHIQNIGDASGGNCTGQTDGTTTCDPSQTGPGSLKIGALGDSGDVPEIPEPTTFTLVAGGLLAAAAWRSRRRLGA